MDYVINPIWIYLMDISGNLRDAAIGLSALGSIITVILGVVFAIEGEYLEDDVKEKIFKAAKALIITVVVSGIVSIFVPSEKTIVKMIIAKNVTYSNLEKAEDKVKDVVDYMFEKVDQAKDIVKEVE